MANRSEKQTNFWASKRRTERVRKTIAMSVIVLMSTVMIIPLAWMVAISLKEPQNVFKLPPWRVDWRWSNYFESWYPHGLPELGGDIEEEHSTYGSNRFTLSKANVVQGSVSLVAEKRYVRDGSVVGTLTLNEGKDYKVDTDTGVVVLLRSLADAKFTAPAVEMGSGAKAPPQDKRNRTVIVSKFSYDPGLSFGGKVQEFFAGRESFWIYLWNTLVITISATFGSILSAAFVAFGFARLRFPLKGPLFLLALATMMIPQQVVMIPTFVLFSKMRLTDSFYPLILPAFFGGGAYNIFLLRQFFMTIPYELDEAAKIDGCSTFGIFWRIMLPLSVPAMITVTIFAVVWNWNDFMNPLIYLNSSENYTLALGLSQFSSLYGNKTNLMMAASTVVLMPILILFFVGQKQFIQGIATTGIKG